MKPHIFLDLDQTIVSAESSISEKYCEKQRLFEYVDFSNLYRIFARPHLQEFLDFLFANFEVSVWTAADKEYAIFIIDHLILGDTDRKLNYIFYSYHCGISTKYKDCAKSMVFLREYFNLDLDLDKTLLIDDREDLHRIQPKLTMLAPPFEFKASDSENDTFLKDAIVLLSERFRISRSSTSSSPGRTRHRSSF